MDVHLGRARPDPGLRQERRERAGHSASMPGDRRSSGRRPAAGLRDQHGRDRALDAGDRRSSLCDLGPRRGRRPRRRAIDRGRAAARDRQRALARRLLQDAGPERSDGSPSAVARALLLVVAVAAAYTASTKPADILAMVGWAFSLAMAGNFPALIMGVWWKRTTAAGAIAGIIAGFGIALFYLVVSRYFPGFGVKYAGMTSLLNPVTGAPLVDIAKAMTALNAMDAFPTLAHPLANKVGWFNLTNIACGLLAMPVGFLTIIIVSLLGKEPSKEMQAYVDEIRKPRGRTVLEEKTT